MNCLVTGGNGFIGRHVVNELLKRGFKVAVYDIDPNDEYDGSFSINYICDDILNLPKLREACMSADMIFHLSGLLGTAELFQSPREAIETNVIGALNVITAINDSRKRARVFFPAKPNHWNNIYSVTAQAVEKLGHAYREKLRFDIRILRLFNVYGPKQALFPIRKAVPYFVFAALENRPLSVFSPGKQLVELLYVEDIAKAIVDYMMMDNLVTETFELGGYQISVEALAHKIISAANSKSDLAYLPIRRGESPQALSERMRDLRQFIGERKMTSLDRGLETTIEWYRANPSKLAQAKVFYDSKETLI